MKNLLLSLCVSSALATAATTRAQTPGAPAASPPTASPAATAPGATPTAAQAAEQPRALPTPTPTEDEQALLKLEQDWGDATMKGDVAFVDRSEAEEYVYTDPNGQLSNKKDSLEAAKGGAAKISSFKIRDVKVHVYGDSAVLTGQTQLKGKDENGGDFSGDYRWTDVFVRRDGRWQAVASQATTIQSNDSADNTQAVLHRPTAEGLPAPAFLRVAGPLPLTITPEEKALIQLEQDWAKACATGDTAFADYVEAEEYVFTALNGQKRNKSQDIAFLKANPIKFELRSIQAHIDGDTAVVSGEATETQGAISAEIRWTDHFVRRNGRWQAVSGESKLAQ